MHKHIHITFSTTCLLLYGAIVAPVYDRGGRESRTIPSHTTKISPSKKCCRISLGKEGLICMK